MNGGRLEKLVAENKQLKTKVDYMARQGQEVDFMREHENLKIMKDT